MLPGRNNDTDGLGYFYNFAIARSMELTFDFRWVRSAFDGIDDSIIVAARLNVRF